jgi:hypothetical protein
MTKTSKLLLAGMLAFSTLVSVPVIAHAQTNSPTSSTAPCTSGQDCPQKGLNDIRQAFPQGATREQDIGQIAHKIINWALYLAAIIAVIFIIYGGFLYITSAGNATQAGNGRTTLVNALIGLVIIVLSYMLVQVVYNFVAN